jgi:hypothetical protein
MRKVVSDITYDKPLNKDDDQDSIFEAAEIARLMKDIDKEVRDGEDEDKNKEDDTLFEYRSEDEGSGTIEVDSDNEYSLHLFFICT